MALPGAGKQLFITNDANNQETCNFHPDLLCNGTPFCLLSEQSSSTAAAEEWALKKPGKETVKYKRQNS